MKRVSVLVPPLAALLALWLAARQNMHVLHLREQEQLGAAPALDNAPPLVVFTTVALGGFRGIIADMLWLRVAHLQDQGRYFELVQLADWITKLEPRVAEVWSYHAWNLAYNVSVTMSDPADRWRWVSHGLDLLRKQGLHYNPGDARLYSELAWMFLHKIGGVSDEAHSYYKARLAMDVERLIPGGVADYAALAADPDRVGGLREAFGLQVDRMRAIDARYGPFDWRVPYAHAVYWAREGAERAEGFEALRCDRLVYQAMVEAFRKGRLIVDPVQERVALGFDPDLLPGVRCAFEEAARRHGEETVRIAYATFLRRAVRMLHAAGRGDEAQALFDDGRRRFPEDFAADDLDGFLAAPEDRPASAGSRSIHAPEEGHDHP